MSTYTNNRTRPLTINKNITYLGNLKSSRIIVAGLTSHIWSRQPSSSCNIFTTLNTQAQNQEKQSQLKEVAAGVQEVIFSDVSSFQKSSFRVLRSQNGIRVLYSDREHMSQQFIPLSVSIDSVQVHEFDQVSFQSVIQSVVALILQFDCFFLVLEFILDVLECQDSI